MVAVSAVPERQASGSAIPLQEERGEAEDSFVGVGDVGASF